MTFARFVPFVLVLAAPAAAVPGALRFDNGFGTVSAKTVPVRQVLAEWARLGNTRVVNGEKLPGGLVTLELVHVPEKQALEILLRSASGYLAAPRTQFAATLSTYDRIVVMPTSTAAPPAATAGYHVPPPQMPPPQAGFNGGMPVPVPEDQDDQVNVNPDGSPANPGEVAPDQGQPQGPPPAFGQPGPQVPGAARPNDTDEPSPAQQAPAPVPPGPTPLPQGVITAPMPGQMPTPEKPPQ
jgi:hypothetical protein